MPTPFRCTIVTPEREILDEEVEYVDLPAHDGQLGVAHLRAPLMAKLGYGPLRLDLADGGRKTFFVGGGFAQVKNDVLTVLTDEAKAKESIDREEAQASLKEALAFVPTDEAGVTRRNRDVARARAMVAVAPKD